MVFRASAHQSIPSCSLWWQFVWFENTCPSPQPSWLVLDGPQSLLPLPSSFCSLQVSVSAQRTCTRCARASSARAARRHHTSHALLHLLVRTDVAAELVALPAPAGLLLLVSNWPTPPRQDGHNLIAKRALEHMQHCTAWPRTCHMSGSCVLEFSSPGRTRLTSLFLRLGITLLLVSHPHCPVSSGFLVLHAPCLPGPCSHSTRRPRM